MIAEPGIGQGFMLDHVQPGGRDPSGFQRFEQRLLVNARPAGRVDQVTPGRIRAMVSALMRWRVASSR